MSEIDLVVEEVPGMNGLYTVEITNDNSTDEPEEPAPIRTITELSRVLSEPLEEVAS